MIVKIAILGINEQEVKILETVFIQRKFEVRVLSPNTSSYLELMKFKPDAVILEMPQKDQEQIHLAKLIRSNKSLSGCALLTYGSHSVSAKSKHYQMVGIRHYFPRPLKISFFFDSLVSSLGQDIEKLINGDQTAEKDERTKDIMSLLKPDVAPTHKIELLVKHVGKLMAFPFSIAKIVLLTGSEKSSAAELANVIRSDASIATSIIKLSNSVFFASRNREISDVLDAIVRIGFDQTKKVALGLSVMQLLDKDEKNFGFNRQQFWYHSLATALISEKLAKAISHPDSSLAFLCGLLHDFAVLLYDEFFGEIFEVLMETTLTRNITFTDAGIELLKFDQNDFMDELFVQWNMPKDLRTALKGFHSFLSVNEGLPQNDVQLIKAIGFAELLAKSAHIGQSCDEILHEVPESLLQQFKFGTGVRDGFFEQIYNQINIFVMLLNLESCDFPTQLFPGKSESEPRRLLIIKSTFSLYDPHLFYLTHTGFENVPFPSAEDITDELMGTIQLIVYDIADSENFSDLEEQHSIIQDFGKPSLIFYRSDNSKASIPELINSITLHTNLDAKQIFEAVNTLLLVEIEPTPLDKAESPIDAAANDSSNTPEEDKQEEAV